MIFKFLHFSEQTSSLKINVGKGQVNYGSGGGEERHLANWKKPAVTQKEEEIIALKLWKTIMLQGGLNLGNL